MRLHQTTIAVGEKLAVVGSPTILEETLPGGLLASERLLILVSVGKEGDWSPSDECSTSGRSSTPNSLASGRSSRESRLR